jgi:hypothetical protein
LFLAAEVHPPVHPAGVELFATDGHPQTADVPFPGEEVAAPIVLAVQFPRIAVGGVFRQLQMGEPVGHVLFFLSQLANPLASVEGHFWRKAGVWAHQWTVNYKMSSRTSLRGLIAVCRV